LALVAAKVQHLKCTEVFPGGFFCALNTYQPLTRGVDAEFPEVGGNPLSPQFFSDGCGGARSGEEVGD
jgi:hypothetical protein